MIFGDFSVARINDDAFAEHRLQEKKGGRPLQSQAVCTNPGPWYPSHTGEGAGPSITSCMHRSQSVIPEPHWGGGHPLGEGVERGWGSLVS